MSSLLPGSHAHSARILVGVDFPPISPAATSPVSDYPPLPSLLPPQLSTLALPAQIESRSSHGLFPCHSRFAASVLDQTFPVIESGLVPPAALGSLLKPRLFSWKRQSAAEARQWIQMQSWMSRIPLSATPVHGHVWCAMKNDPTLFNRSKKITHHCRVTSFKGIISFSFHFFCI